MHKNRQPADPLKTRTGKTRLGPLNINKLEEMLKSARAKDRSKIENRIRHLNRLGHFSKNVNDVVEVSAE
jgi:hypothetical protein